MKNCLLPILLFCSIGTFAQDIKFNFGKEAEVKGTYTHYGIISSNQDGMFILEAHIIRDEARKEVVQYQLVGYNESLDRIFAKVYNYGKKFFFSAFSFKNRIYAVFREDAAGRYLYCAEVNKKTGELLTDLKEVSFAPLNEYNYLKNFTVGSDYIVFAVNSSKGLSVTAFDENLTQVIKTEIAANLYPDFFFKDYFSVTADKRIVLFGREYDVENPGTRKSRRYLKSFYLGSFGADGKLLAKHSLRTDKDFVGEGAVNPLSSDRVCFTGLCFKDSKDGEITGAYSLDIDLKSTKLSKFIYAPVTDEMVGNDEFISKGKEGKKPIKWSCRLMATHYDPKDSSVIILAEQWDFSLRSETSMVGDSRRVPDGADIITANVVATKLNRDGKVQWVRMIPKYQKEILSKYELAAMNFESQSYLGFMNFVSAPYFSSFFSTVINGKLILVFNDDGKNANVTEADDKIKMFIYDKKNYTYKMTVNLSDGKVSRNILYTNNEGFGGMVRFATGSSSIVFPFLQRQFFKKDLMKFARIDLN